MWAPPTSVWAPRLPFAISPGNFRTPSITEVLDVFVQVDRRSESGVDAAFHAKPFIGEISHGRVGSNRSGVVIGRAKAQQGYAQRELPAKIVAATGNEFWFRRGRQGFGWARCLRDCGGRQCVIWRRERTRELPRVRHRVRFGKIHGYTCIRLRGRRVVFLRARNARGREGERERRQHK